MKIAKTLSYMIRLLTFAAIFSAGVGICQAMASEISAGNFHTMAIKSNGTLWAWGWNCAGQLGDGTHTDRRTPVQIGTGINWAQLSAGFHHTMALKNGGTLWAWGLNDYGMLGDGTAINRPTPVQIGTDTDWAQVSAGYYHTIALKKDGMLWACGYNDYGQLGDGTVVDRMSPVQIVSLIGTAMKRALSSAKNWLLPFFNFDEFPAG